MKIIMGGLVCALALSANSTAFAQQLIYTPTNPTFGGNPFNSAHMLALAAAQNQYQNKGKDADVQTQGELFAAQLQGQLLSSLATQVTQAIFGDNPQQSGTISFGGQTVSFVRGLDGVKITITDAKGAQTNITVPTFVKIQ